MKHAFLATAIAAVALATGAVAQQAPAGKAMPMQQGKGMQHDRMMMMDMDPSMMGGPAGRDYMAAMQQMHQEMMRMREKDPDRAFAQMMIAHHGGAIAMTEALMKHGKDAELKAMAKKSSDEQKKEIGELQDWLKRHPAGAPGR
jgi:uncharacterized protein (DUF305 family)